MSGAEAKKLPQDGGQVTQRPGHAGAAGFSGRTPALPAEYLPLADVLLFT